MDSFEYRNSEEFLRNGLYAQGAYSMPFIYSQESAQIIKNIELLAFDKTHTIELLPPNKRKAVHFFLDDYKFDEVWNSPSKYIRKLAQYSSVLTPDFSTYINMPIVLQIYNTFRNRWCGAYWQKNGLTVIPTIGWGDENSYDFCFDGVQKGSVVAVSTLGNVGFEEDFMQGYNEMIKQLEPTKVINYGTTFKGMDKDTDLIKVPYTLKTPSDLEDGE